MSDIPDDSAPSFGLGLGTVLAVLAMVAAGLGWRLSWSEGQEHLRKMLDLSPSEVDELQRELARPGSPEDAHEAVRRLKENSGVRGIDVLALLDYAASSGRIDTQDAVEGRAWTAARWAGHALVWVPWALLAIVLVHGNRPLGIVARGLLIAHGVIVLAGGALIALGASPLAQDAFQADPMIVGYGLYAVLAGGLVGLLVGLFGGKRGGFFGALGFAILILGSAGGALVAYLKA
jgi:hypothetical protein